MWEVVCDFQGAIQKARSSGEHGVRPSLAPVRYEVCGEWDSVVGEGGVGVAVVYIETFLVGIDREVVVDAELAEFVHDDSVFLSMLFAQDAVEQGGLAGAEIAGQHGHGDLSLGHGIPRKLFPELGWRGPSVTLPGR